MDDRLADDGPLVVVVLRAVQDQLEATVDIKADIKADINDGTRGQSDVHHD